MTGDTVTTDPSVRLALETRRHERTRTELDELDAAYRLLAEEFAAYTAHTQTARRDRERYRLAWLSACRRAGDLADELELVRAKLVETERGYLQACQVLRGELP